MPREIKFVKGDTVDQKFLSIERTLHSFQRRLRKTLVGLLPPIPVFGGREVIGSDGVVFRVVLPAKGTITKAYIVIKDYKVAKEVKFNFTLARTAHGSFSEFTTRRHYVSHDVNMQVEAGDFLTLTVDPPENVENVWVSFLYEIGLKDLKIEKFLIDELERLLEEDK
jgi:hypothetical protein